MVAAYATGDYTMQAIADFFGVHYATVNKGGESGGECVNARPDPDVFAVIN
jgi:hypothetical protein